ERHKALGVLGTKENVRGILDTDGVVCGRVEHQQRFVQIGEAILDALLRDVIKEFALDTEWAPGELHFDLALLADLVDVVLEQTDDVRGIARSSNSNNRAGVRDPVRSSAAQAVADQNCGCPVGLTEM